MNPAQYILIAGIRVYQWTISPAKFLIFGPAGRCRFHPSCSGYALEAVKKHGAVTGGWLALKRLSRCHPWGGCGWDPVPEAKAKEPHRGDRADRQTSASQSLGAAAKVA